MKEINVTMLLAQHVYFIDDQDQGASELALFCSVSRFGVAWGSVHESCRNQALYT